MFCVDQRRCKRLDVGCCGSIVGDEPVAERPREDRTDVLGPAGRSGKRGGASAEKDAGASAEERADELAAAGADELDAG